MAVNVVVGLVFDIPKAQRTGVELVFVFVCGRGDNRPIQLGVFIDGDIETAFAYLNSVSADWLIFEECQLQDELKLKLKFEDIKQMDEEELKSVTLILDALILKYQTKNLIK
ncbi:RstR family transcriptional regulator [Providencia alcalifaciens]|uniref:Uncharacterized protein n=1 Tax=Providencia alcalifaciens DSM 30120 TaxID=520999 RepID=B6XC55_9GAMM|nr:hypothetical protein [Providencia alcalifaciens]EEB47207.1 hypothetical protein PROVALCAL_00917 [Providencia alcalifaciens DSM 30120]SQI33850.1 Uncharacterised protein [Providencia alcalifaciens]